MHDETCRTTNVNGAAVNPPAAPRNDRRSAALRWFVAGATVLSLGVGGALLAQQAQPTQASPNLTAVGQPQPPTPPQNPVSQNQTRPTRLGVAVEESQTGLTVRRVMPNSAAAQAGVQVNDIITAVNGQLVKTVADVRQQLQGKQPGTAVTLSVTRNGVATTLTATLAQPPAPNAAQGAPGGQRRGPGGAGAARGHGGMFGVPGIDALQGVAPQDRFAHMLGATFTVTDASGRRVTYETVPGKVVSATATNVTVQANDPNRGTVTYTITADTKQPGRGRPGTGNAPVAPTLQAGTPIVVIAEQGQTVAKAIMGGGAGGHMKIAVTNEDIFR